DEVVVTELNGPGERTQVAEDRLQQRGLASPVGADDADDLVVGHSHTDGLENLQLPVTRSQRLDEESQRPPRRCPSSAPITRSSRRMASGDPSAIFSP